MALKQPGYWGNVRIRVLCRMVFKFPCSTTFLPDSVSFMYQQRGDYTLIGLKSIVAFDFLKTLGAFLIQGYVQLHFSRRSNVCTVQP
jgi:hypothetical protein